MTLSEALTLADRYDVQIRAMEDKAIARLNKALDSAYKALERDLKKSYGNIASNATLLQSQRRALIIQELGSLLQLVNPEMADTYEQAFAELMRDTTNTGLSVAGLLSQAVGNERLKPFANISIDAVAASAKGSYARLSRHGETFADTATNIISMGIVQGWGIQRIMTPLQQQLGITKSRAESIARYESSAAYNDAAVERYKEAEVEWITWLAIGDRVTCGYCLARHMRTYALADGIRPPIHPRCRCTGIPLKKAWVEMGMIDRALYKGERDRALAESNIKPNYQLASFEKQAGLTAQPKPVWEPS